MNLVELIDSLDMSPIKKTMYHSMAQYFQTNLPDSLYLNTYELNQNTDIPPQEWRNFLKIPEINQFIEQELAMIAEIAARASLKRLQSSGASSQDISAAKQLLETSRLLKQKTESRQNFVIINMPTKEKADA